jgi:hypothetical protein
MWTSPNRSVERRRAIAFALELTAALVICYCMIGVWELLDAGFGIYRGKQGITSPPVANAIAYCAMAIVVLKVYRLGPWHSRLSFYVVLELTFAAALAGVAGWSLTGESSGRERAFLISLTVSLLIGLLSIRIAVTALGGLAEKYFPSRERMAIFGDEASLAVVMKHLGQQNRTVFRGVILPEENSIPGADINVLGTAKQLAQVINRERLDRIVIPEGYPEHAVEECIRISRRMGVTVSRPIIVPATHVQVSLVQIAGIHLLDMTPIFFTKRQELIKRIFDVVVSGTCLLTIAPLLVVLAVLVKITSPGPIFFISSRVGRGGRHFSFFKFRTMYAGSEDRKSVATLNEKSGHLFKLRRDPRNEPGWTEAPSSAGHERRRAK